MFSVPLTLLRVVIHVSSVPAQQLYFIVVWNCHRSNSTVSFLFIFFFYSVIDNFPALPTFFVEGKWRKTVLFFAAEKITNGGERRRRKEEKRERERMMAGGMGWDKQEAEEGYDDKATPTGKKKKVFPPSSLDPRAR